MIIWNKTHTDADINYIGIETWTEQFILEGTTKGNLANTYYVTSTIQSKLLQSMCQMIAPITSMNQMQLMILIVDGTWNILQNKQDTDKCYMSYT